MNKKSKKTIVIGAGPAGLACAYELGKKGLEVEVYEASQHVGGMSRSFELWEQKVDLGPHRFFSKDKKINGFFFEVLEGEYSTVNRLTRIFYNNRFFLYPLKIFNVLANLNPITIAIILWDYLIQRIRPINNPRTFEEWVTNRFGKKLYEIFFKSYSEKLWGIPCSQIDADWASQRIKTLSLLGAVISSIKGDADNKHKTLVDEFFYPKNGTGSLYEKCAEKIETAGGKIHLNTPVKKVILNSHNAVEGIELNNGTLVKADHIVSTMPFTSLILGLDNVPKKVITAASKLYFRNTVLVYLEVNSTKLFQDNWIYVHSKEVQLGRITNFRNWCPSLYRNKETTIICLEYWAFEEDDIWRMNDSEICRNAILEIEKISLAKKDLILNSKVIKLPKCYPVYETGYKKHLAILENHIDKIGGLTPIGRYGSFKYNNQDHSILMGMITADKINGESNANLWDINTDIEYQEDGELESN